MESLRSNLNSYHEINWVIRSPSLSIRLTYSQEYCQEGDLEILYPYVIHLFALVLATEMSLTYMKFDRIQQTSSLERKIEESPILRRESPWFFVMSLCSELAPANMSRLVIFVGMYRVDCP